MEKKQIKEATSSGSSGKFKVPIVLAPQPWTENELGPFTDSVYHYTNAELAYEEADGDFKETPEVRSKIENRTKKLSQVTSYLKKFYRRFMESEAGHYTLFIDLATLYFGKEKTLARWAEWLAYEKEVMESMEIRGDRIH